MVLALTEKMKILILQDDFPPKSYGGAGVVSFNMAQGLKDKGHDVYVVSTVKNKEEEGKEELKGVKIYNIYSNYHERWRAYLSLYNPMVIKKVKILTKEIKPDIVFANNVHFHISYYSLKLAKNSGAKVFLIAHDAMTVHYGKMTKFVKSSDLSLPDRLKYKINFLDQIKKFKKRYNPLRNIIIKHYLKYVDKIFSVSEALKDALKENGIDNVETIHNGIDISRWAINTSNVEAFKTLYKLKDKKIILFGGRLSESKGGYKIIYAVKKVLSKIPNVVLLVLGKEDEYSNMMLGKARGLNMGNKIIFTGWISGKDLVSAYHSSDVVVVPSVYLDPFPTVNLEAMACAKPIVGTCFGGTPEIVEDNLTGFIVNPFNTEVMAEKISYLLLNPKKAREFGKRGYNKVKEKFNIDKWIDEYLRYI